MTGAGKKPRGEDDRGRGRGRGVRGVSRGPRGGTPSPNPAPGPSVQAYDGPASDRGRSPSGGQPESRGPSPGRADTRRRGEVPAGFDPLTGKAYVLQKNVDFGGDAYNLNNKMPTSLMRRGGFGKAGKQYKVAINSYKVENWPNLDVFQYDITIGSNEETRGLVKSVWMTKTVQDAIGDAFIWDGNKLGWSYRNIPEQRFQIDLDKEKGNTPRPGTQVKTTYRCVIRPSGRIRLASLRAYLEGGADFDVAVLQGINFLDHLLRETPSKKMINLRRSYFHRQGDHNGRYLVGQGVEALKGVYQSLRAGEGSKLVINADVANSCFWQESCIDHLAFALSGVDYTKFQALIGRNDRNFRKTLNALTKNRFTVTHRGQTDKSKTYTIDKISLKNADTYKFDVKDKDGKVTSGVSIREYFHKKYNIYLNKPWLPLIETSKKNEVYPMELCLMSGGQSYHKKLNEEQTAKMIKFAVSRPPQRLQAINTGLGLLEWGNDPMLKKYGMKINPNMIQTNARVLDPPEVLFGKGATARPMFSGRWDLRGKTFLAPNPTPLKSWGVCVLSGADGGNTRAVPSMDQVKAFIANFIKLYRGHGGQVSESDPTVISGVPDTAKAIEACFMGTGNKAQIRPQMILVVLTNKNAEIYERVKKNCDIRWGVMSQCVQGSNLIKNAPQYCSNVLMKFNCKLGGTTSAIKARKPHFSVPTMIIGADVSHAAGGIMQVSIASLTMSLDTTCSRYAAAVQSNGIRVEMITPDNMMGMMQPLIQHWMETVGKGAPPKHVYYFRDGVSEGQFGPLLKNEVADLKLAFHDKLDGKAELMPKFTVVVCEKRHHIRFFPTPGPGADKNGNPVPGTIVDHDVTHPFENDVYLSAHSAIQGTARPTHYQMIMDEAKINVDQFQALLYEHCYQYQRATTPVSLFPAVYYAHLAAARSYAHIDRSVFEAWVERRQREEGVKNLNQRLEGQSECPKLLKMDPKNRIAFGMWYI